MPPDPAADGPYPASKLTIPASMQGFLDDGLAPG